MWEKIMADHIAFYGKGGVGKTTLVLSAQHG
jgi:anion-transporting  ArsA/GET3 family ATPase